MKKEGSVIEMEGGIVDMETLSPLDPSQDLIFPPELMLSCNDELVVFRGERVTWYRPIGLSQLLELKQKHPEAKLVVGSTELSVELRFKNTHYPVVISPTQVCMCPYIYIVIQCDSENQGTSGPELAAQGFELGN